MRLDGSQGPGPPGLELNPPPSTQVPMPVLITAHSLSRNDGDVWLDKAVTRTDSFPYTDADTSARYCRTLQHSAPDPPACTGLQRHAISTLNTPTTPFGSVLADIPWVPRERASGLYICTVSISRQRHVRLMALLGRSRSAALRNSLEARNFPVSQSSGSAIRTHSGEAAFGMVRKEASALRGLCGGGRLWGGGAG